jgi:hypothetical protein
MGLIFVFFVFFVSLRVIALRQYPCENHFVDRLFYWLNQAIPRLRISSPTLPSLISRRAITVGLSLLSSTR